MAPITASARMKKASPGPLSTFLNVTPIHHFHHRSLAASDQQYLAKNLQILWEYRICARPDLRVPIVKNCTLLDAKARLACMDSIFYLMIQFFLAFPIELQVSIIIISFNREIGIPREILMRCTILVQKFDFLGTHTLYYRMSAGEYWQACVSPLVQWFIWKLDAGTTTTSQSFDAELQLYSPNYIIL